MFDIWADAETSSLVSLLFNPKLPSRSFIDVHMEAGR